MNKLTIIKSVVISLIALCSCKSTNVKQEKPNIIVIMVDDMGYSDIGSYGGEIDSPNIDKMASEGLRFTNFYNCSRCCPTNANFRPRTTKMDLGPQHRKNQSI